MLQRVKKKPLVSTFHANHGTCMNVVSSVVMLMSGCLWHSISETWLRMTVQYNWTTNCFDASCRVAMCRTGKRSLSRFISTSHNTFKKHNTHVYKNVKTYAGLSRKYALCTSNEFIAQAWKRFPVYNQQQVDFLTLKNPTHNHVTWSVNPAISQLRLSARFIRSSFFRDDSLWSHVFLFM